MDQGEEKPKHPITGEPYDEEAERARLSPIDQISNAEVQAKFKDFIGESFRDNPDKRKINANKLLEVKKHGNRVMRIYYSYNPQITTFLEKAKVELLEHEKEGKILEIIKYGEDRAEYTHLRFNQVFWTIDEGATVFDSGLEVNTSYMRNKFEIKYDQNGKIIQLRFYEKGRTHPTSNINIHALEKTGKFTISVVGKERDHWEIDDLGERIIYTREIDEQLQQRLTVPIKINKDQLLERICPPALIENPYEAKSDLDDKWLSQDLLKDVVGINWQRS